jgi:hypothetical protein
MIALPFSMLKSPKANATKPVHREFSTFSKILKRASELYLTYEILAAAA